MTSPTRKYDMEIRAIYLEILASCLRTGHQDFAKFFGEQSQQLKQRITSHDYSEEDESWYKVEKIIKQQLAFEKWLQTKDDWYLTPDRVKVKKFNGKIVKI